MTTRQTESASYPRHTHQCQHPGCSEWATKGVGLADYDINTLGQSHDCCHRHCRTSPVQTGDQP